MIDLLPVLLDRLSALQTGDQPIVVGISGAPGSGKTTLARMLSEGLTAMGKSCQLVSLDDYYLPRNERLILANNIHPLCAVRGVPGTHDLGLLLNHLERLKRGNIAGLSMPKFDKSTDERLPESSQAEVKTAPCCILLEGWVLATPPQRVEELIVAVNRLEAKRDPNMIWRNWVNQALEKYHRALRDRLDTAWYLRAPDWTTVVDWRWQQEQELAKMALRSRSQVENFLAHYQRLVEHMQSSCNEWADLVVPLDTKHCATIST